MPWLFCGVRRFTSIEVFTELLCSEFDCFAPLIGLCLAPLILDGIIRSRLSSDGLTCFCGSSLTLKLFSRFILDFLDAALAELPMFSC